MGFGVSIRVESVTKTFQLDNAGEAGVFAKFDLHVPAGSFCAILGPSGCGKSTLLRLLAGLETPESGQIVIGQSRDGRPPRVGLMLQQYPSLPWLTVAKNIELALSHSPSKRGKKHSRERALYYLSRVGLAGWENAYPRELSGGMLQRLALARTLAMEPDLVLLDEPLGALDALTRHDLQCLIRDLYQAEPRTYVMVTHDVDEALAVADRIVVLGPAGMGIIYDSNAAGFQLDREGLVRLLRGTHVTFAAGNWSGYAAVRKAAIERGTRVYDFWLGMSDSERIAALCSGRLAGAFFTVPSLAELSEELAEVDPVVVHAFSRPACSAACEQILLHRQPQTARVLRWAVPGKGLESAVVRRIDGPAFPERVFTYADRAACVTAVARGDADACITDVALLKQLFPWWARWNMTIRPLPDEIWKDLWTVLVVPRRFLSDEREAIAFAVKKLAEDASNTSGRSGGRVHYLDPAASRAALSNGKIVAALERWGGNGLSIESFFTEGASASKP